MKLISLLNLLGTTHLKNYNCSQGSTIKRTDVNNIIVLINSGINYLSTQFNLKRKIVEVDVISGTTDYLVSENDSVIEIINVLDISGNVLWFRLKDNNTIEIEPEVTGKIFVECYYKPSELLLFTPTELDTVDFSTINVDIPNMYVHALCLYIAMEYTISFEVGGGTKTPFNVSNNFKELYDMEIQRLINKGFDVDPDVDLSNKFGQKGFV